MTMPNPPPWLGLGLGTWTYVLTPSLATEYAVPYLIHISLAETLARFRPAAPDSPRRYRSRQV